MDQFNLLDFDKDVLNIIGDYVKKDNHDRLQKICQKYAKLYRKLDRKKESKRRYNLNDEKKKDNLKLWETDKHFYKLIYLINNKYKNNISELIIDRFISKPCIIFIILIDGEYKRFRYF